MYLCPLRKTFLFYIFMPEQNILYAICHLSILAVREEPSHKSTMVAQMLYGELCCVTKTERNWAYVRIDNPSIEGWVEQKQLLLIDHQTHTEICKLSPQFSSNVIEAVQSIENPDDLTIVCLGANIHAAPHLGHSFEGKRLQNLPIEYLNVLIQKYLNAPFMLGGRTPFGIDNLWLVRQLLHFVGVQTSADVLPLLSQGEEVSYSDAQIGDVAFFTDAHGKLEHLGIVLDTGLVAHTYEKVRVDAFDTNGIFNDDYDIYTHQFHSIRRLFLPQ